MKKSLKLFSLILAALMLFCVTGCSKDSGELSGEWINEREYYEQDENGNWVLVTDESVIEQLGQENTIQVDTDAEDTESKTEETDKTDKPSVDVSKLEVLTDYMGNDGFEKVFEKKNLYIDSEHADVLQDDYRFRRYDFGEGYATYKVNGISEVLIQYSYGSTDRYAPPMTFSVSKDNQNWTEVKPSNTTYSIYNGDSWVRYVSYIKDIDPTNQYFRMTFNDGAKFVYNPSVNFIQINGITEKLVGEMGGFADGISTAQNIYVDSENGKDTNSGKSEKEALKTLYAASQKSYAPGSKILLKAGQTFSGNLTITGSGTAKKPIIVSSYGKGEKPIISARGGAAVAASGEYIEITGLKITNKAGKSGIQVYNCKPGASKGIKITKCDFYDINVNFNDTSNSSCGIYLYASGREPAWFDGVTIEDNTFKHVARNGIHMTSDWCSRSSKQGYSCKNDVEKGEYFPSTNVVIRNNRLDEQGGDGIFLLGCKGALVEKNVVANSGLFKNKGEIHWAAVWCHSSEDCVFQYNEVYGNSSKNNGHDLQAFDADIANKNCIFQYNYSHDNEGGFMLFCTNDASLGKDYATTGTIVRYNLSVNDGFGKNLSVFDITSSCYDSLIYNNTIFCGKDTKLVNFANYDGGPNDSKNTVFKNNIFCAAEGTKVGYGYSRLESAVFDNNLFYNIDAPADARIKVSGVITEDPKLSELGATGNGLEAIAKKYLPKSGSPVLSKGIKIENNGGKDLLGKKVNDTLIGALIK